MSNFYRGLAKELPVGASVHDVMALGGMDFEVEKVPVQYTYNGELRTRSGLELVVRKDTGAALAHCSTRFQPHQNEELISPFMQLAQAGGITLKASGTFNGGTEDLTLYKTPEDLIAAKSPATHPRREAEDEEPPR